MEARTRYPRNTSTVAVALLAATFAYGCGQSTTVPDDAPDPTTPAANQAPTAVAGADVSASVGLTVSVDGSASTDPDGDAITYAWTFTSPAGSGAALDDATLASPSFLPDVAGTYVASLTVSDGEATSAADEVSIAAADNTVTTSVVAAAGGTVTTGPSGVTLTVPAGAMTDDTDISITPIGPGQLPTGLQSLPGEATVFDLQPSGLQFSTDAQLSLTVDDAISEGAGGVTMVGAFLLSESGGVIEGLSDIGVVPDPADPTKAVITGGISHFSAAVLVVASMEFRADLPTTARVGEPFDVTTMVDITGAGIGDIVSATMEDVSLAPVSPGQGFTADLSGTGTVWTVTNSYTCADVGTGRFRANIGFSSSDLFGSFATIQLGMGVTCTEPPPPLATNLLSLFRAGRLMPVPGSSTDITAGGEVRRIDLETEAAVVDVAPFWPIAGDRAEFVNALSDGSYLVHTLLGQVARVVPGADPVVDTAQISPFEQARHVQPVSSNVVALASAFGDLGLMTYTPGGGFIDSYRDLTVLGGPQQAGTNLQAIWMTPDAQTMIAAVTEGDGDSAFNDTQIALLTPDGQTGNFNRVVLPGIIGRTLDSNRRHQFDLECREQGAALFLCVFTSGFEGPAFNEDTEGDGYVVIFMVDTFSQTGDVRWSESGNARVGGAVFQLEPAAFGIAAANQFTGEIDLWRMDDSTVGAPISVGLDGKCPNPIDLISIDEGRLTALGCQTAAFSPDSGVLVVKGLPGQAEPGS